MNECVRCKKPFEQFYHPMAHFFSICPDCRKESPETSYDQYLYHIHSLPKEAKR